MKLCRYNDNAIGVVKGGQIFDATAALDGLAPVTWPHPPGDQLIANLDRLRPKIEAAARTATPVDISSVTLLSPVANPNKIIAAPVNYQAHHDEALQDDELAQGKIIHPIEKAGLFLKANSSLVGPAHGVEIRFVDKRNDHEVELVVIIGKPGTHISPARAMAHVAGYAIGLDMSMRGTEDRSFRKSADSYTVLGPWLVTADEIDSPGGLELSLDVNATRRQSANTAQLIFDIPRLIEYASSVYTLYPGDLIMTGTPEGVGPVDAGDEMVAKIEKIGEMRVAVHKPRKT